MAYVDYKCLESLLIEGEDLIATEGIGSAIAGLVKNLWKIITNAISVIIKCFKGLFAKLKRSKGNKNKVSQDEKERNVEEDIAESKKKLEEQKTQFAKNHTQRQAELNEAINRMNKSVYRKDDDDDDKNEKSGSEIAKDILKAISYIDEMTQNAHYCMDAILSNRVREDIEDALPSSPEIKDLITKIESMQTTIDLYDLADDKLSDNNKNDICNRLQTATNKLETMKTNFDKSQTMMLSKLDRLYPEYDTNYDKSAAQAYKYMNRQIRDIQNGLINAQKLAVSLAKII